MRRVFGLEALAYTIEPGDIMRKILARFAPPTEAQSPIPARLPSRPRDPFSDVPT